MQLGWTEIWTYLKVVEVEKEEGNVRNDKRKLKNQIFPFHMTMRNWLEGGFVLQAKENFKADFAWSCKNFAQSCKMVQEAVTIVAKFLISYNHAKLVELVRNDHFVVKL